MVTNKKLYKWHGKDGKFWQWLSFRLPRKLIYFACIRGVAIAISGNHSNTVIPKLKAMDMIKRLE